MSKTKAIFNSAIVLYFVICLEILIMISPFAGFFYSVFILFFWGWRSILQPGGSAPSSSPTCWCRPMSFLSSYE